MKKVFLGLALITSLFSYAAEASSTDCSPLLGDYYCSYQGDDVALSLSVGDQEDEITISFPDFGEGGTYIFDGVLRESVEDDSQYIAQCSADQQMLIRNYFRDELKGTASFSKAGRDLSYKLQSSSGRTLVLECTEK